MTAIVCALIDRVNAFAYCPRLAWTSFWVVHGGLRLSRQPVLFVAPYGPSQAVLQGRDAASAR